MSLLLGVLDAGADVEDFCYLAEATASQSLEVNEYAGIPRRLRPAVGDGNGGFTPQLDIAEPVSRVCFVSPESFHAGDMVGGVEVFLGDPQLKPVFADAEENHTLSEETMTSE
jgi:hypothetical protein